MKLGSLTPSTVSSRSSTDWSSASSPSSLSAVSKSSSVLLTTSNIKKRLILNADDQRAKTKPKNQEPKLAAYNVDWFDSSATKNECMKHTSIKNLPDTQEGQISFLLSKFDASDIKIAFAALIGKLRGCNHKAFYPLPSQKVKLIESFLELVHDENSVIVNTSNQHA